MGKARLLIITILLANLFLITATLVVAQPTVIVNYGTALPDGKEFEWNTTPGTSNPDWVASTCANGVQPCTTPTGDIFMRYDANAQPTSGSPNHGTLFILWLARGTYNPDPPTCGKGGGGFPCQNWVQFQFLSGTWTVWDEDSTPYLYPGVTYTPTPNEVWAQLSDGKGWEVSSIEWPCEPPYTRAWNFQSTVNNVPSSTGPVDITFRCISSDSQHGPVVGSTQVPVTDTLTISSTLNITATGTVTWSYCFTNTITSPASAFPGGCLPTDLSFTQIGTTTRTRLNTAPSPIRVAWNMGRGSVIPILLGPELSPPHVFTAVSTIVYTSPSNWAPQNTGTYCFYASYQPDARAAAGGYTPMAHTNNTTECFQITTPTAVSLSSLSAQAGPPNLSPTLIAGLAIGALVIAGAGMIGIGKFFRLF